MTDARPPHATPDASSSTLERTLRRLRALRDLDHAILTATTVDEVAAVAVPWVRELLGTRRAAVVGYDLRAGTGTILAVDEFQAIPEAPVGATFRLPDIIPADLLAAPAQRVYERVEDSLSGLGAARAMVLHGIHVVAWTPVSVDGRLLGMLVMGAPDTAPFTDEGLEIAADIARQIAVGMRVVQERNARERATRRIAALHAIDRAILGTGTFEDAAAIALRGIRELLPIRRATAISYSERHDLATVVAVDEDEPIPTAAPGTTHPLSASIPPELIADPRPHVFDLTQVPERGGAKAMLAHGMSAVAWLPLVLEGELFGMLVLAGADTSVFEGDAMDVGEETARQVAVGFSVARTRAARERAAHRLEVLHSIDHAILDATSIEELADTVLPRVLAGTHASYARLFAYDLAEGTVRLLADVRTDAGPTLQAGTTMPIERVVKRELLQQPRIHKFARLEEARPVQPGDTTLPRELGAHAWVPLLAAGRLVGAFALGYADDAEPDDDDVQIASEVADQLAVAIVHAEARRTAERSLARLELVNTISAAILGAQTPAEVAERAVTPLLGLAKAQRVTVVGYDLVAGTGTVLAFGQEGPGGEMAAGRTFPLEEIMPTEVLLERRAFVFSDLTAIVDDLPASKDAVAQGFKASVIVPLVANGALLGHLAVGSRDAAVANPDNVAVAEEVAKHLAIAIHEAANREALADREERLRVVLDASPNAVLVVDPAGSIQYANQSAGAMFRTDPATLMTHAIGTLVPEGVRSQHPELVARWFTLTSQGISSHPLDTDAVRLDGSKFPVHILHAPVETFGRPVAIVTIVDLSDRVALETRLRQAERMEVLGQFAGMLAHDVRNSLTAVSWVADLLSEDLSADDPRREDVGVIRQAVDDAIAMTRTTLEYARPAANVVGRTDLAAHLAGARKVLSRMLGEQVRLEIEVAPGLPPAAMDPTALTQVLVNLCSNARDAMPTGGTVRITAGIHEAQGPGVQHEILRTDHIDLKVTDTGKGMDEATRSHAFEAFYTTKSVPSEDRRGTGLGLSSVWLLVTAAGGTVKIRSEPGEGTMLTVALPIARP